MTLLEAPIIDLDITDSTNNYAMRLIDADKAQAGLTVTAGSQTNGKGQRGRTWLDVPNQALLMSIIITPRHALAEQFLFNATIAVSIADVLGDLYDSWEVKIKWPNDIIVNDKKAAGILIENVLRGSKWMYSVAGLGLNISQLYFPAELPDAISLKIASGMDFDRIILRDALRERILQNIDSDIAGGYMLERYNQYLYKKNEMYTFSNDSHTWEAEIIMAQQDGMLQVRLSDGSLASYVHGTVSWGGLG